MYDLLNQQAVDAGKGDDLARVFSGTRSECIDYIRRYDPTLRHLYLVPVVVVETHRYFYPETWPVNVPDLVEA